MLGCGLSLLIIIANVLMKLNIYWRSTSLFATFVIFILLFGGIGLWAMVIFDNSGGRHGKKY